MKTRIVILAISLLFANSLFAQKKTTLSVLNADVQGLNYTPEQMGNILRIQIDKLDMFEVMDRYDVAYLIKKNELDISDCYGKICLTEVGSTLKSEKMLMGSIERYGETIIVTLRLIDVATSAIETTKIMEFLNFPNEIQQMIRITLNELLNIENDANMVNKLTQKFDYDSALNNPNKVTLGLSGPRMGYSYYWGDVGRIFQKPEIEGGFDVIPALFMFGYQYEIQYLNEGNIQALFEIIPMVVGLDQGLLIPSLTLLNGLRNNTYGIELAFGPMFSFVKTPEGYKEYANEANKKHYKFTLIKDTPVESIPEGATIIRNLDSRGTMSDIDLSTAFIIGIGKTFRSGKLNIPVNLFFVPSKDAPRIGLSIGYNGRVGN